MKLILAISGGVDSAVLLDVFARGRFEKLGIESPLAHLSKGGRPATRGGGISLHIAHFNHGTPYGKKAEKLVRQLAEKYDLPLHISSTKKQLSSEAAFRDARYQHFAQLQEELGAEVVVTAHHADDQAETILLNLARGSGLTGLSGIQEWSARDELSLWRPLLAVQKSEITTYARRHRLRWLDDPTNESAKYARNRLRKNVLPQLAKINPQIVPALCRTASQLAEARAAIRHMAAAFLGHRTSLPLAQYVQLPSAVQKEVIRLAHERALGHTQRLEEVHIIEVIALTQNPAGNKEKKCGQLIFCTTKQKGVRMLTWRQLNNQRSAAKLQQS